LNKKYFQFEKISQEITELFIYGDIRKPDLIETWFGIDDVTRVDAFSFKDALAAVDTPKLRVRINSYGGSVSEGLAIYSLLSDFKGELETIVDGFACSAASVIFMAGKQRIVPESGLLMIHNAWSTAEGDSNAMRKAADDLEKITQPSINIYVSKTGLSESVIKKMMDNETWITSKEAFEMGFATSIEKDDGAKQALESHYLYKMVIKIKSLEEEIKGKQVIIAAEPQKETKDAWGIFFDGGK
jgi:ATP-dependent Clp protease protease subunit